MKKLIAFLLFVIPTQEGTAQTQEINIGGEAKVGFIGGGTGNTYNTTQIFGKSPEYAELKKRLDGLQAAIVKKADECGQMEKDALPQKYRDGCRAELIALNADRDSVQKIETRFREDVIRLAETFANIPLNSERLRLAKQFFDEGKIREADNVLNVKEMQKEGEDLLTKKERVQQTLQETDSLLNIKAGELALKAVFKLIDYEDSLHTDSAEIYLEHSLRYADDSMKAVLFVAFSLSLYYGDQFPLAADYLEKALQLVHAEDEEASFLMLLGVFYFKDKNMAESEKTYLRALEIYERLVERNPEEYEPDLARTCTLLGNLYFYMGNRKREKDMAESEKMYLRALGVYERLAKNDPEKFESELIYIYQELSRVCLFIQKYPESQDAAEHLLSLDPSLYAVLTKLGHSHLLRGEWDKARAVYEQYIANEKDPAEAKATLLKDWDDLEKAGVTHKDMEKARAWVKE